MSPRSSVFLKKMVLVKHIPTSTGTDFSCFGHSPPSDCPRWINFSQEMKRMENDACAWLSSGMADTCPRCNKSNLHFSEPSWGELHRHQATCTMPFFLSNYAAWNTSALSAGSHPSPLILSDNKSIPSAALLCLRTQMLTKFDNTAQNLHAVLVEQRRGCPVSKSSSSDKRSLWSSIFLFSGCLLSWALCLVIPLSDDRLAVITH